MSELETNIFPITNLNELSSRYRLVEISGLRSDQAEYFQNRQALEKRLSYSLRKPVLVTEKGGAPYLVVPEEVATVPSELELVRLVVQLRPRDEVISLDYANLSPDDSSIAMRFLRFMIQAPLRSDARLWQPGAGRPFFQRTPVRTEDPIHQFPGFSVRPVVAGHNAVGLCLDATTCYVSGQPLATKVTRDEFAKRWKGRNCIYRFGQDWYEVRLNALADRSVTDYRFVKDGKTWSLHQYLLNRAARPLPADLANLPEHSSVVLYLDSRNNELGAASPLCYPVFATSSPEVSRLHSRTILAPHIRRNTTHAFVEQYFKNLRFGTKLVRIGLDPLKAPKKIFSIPDLEFGNRVLLSARGTAGATSTTIRDFGNKRLALLKDPAAGFFNQAPLDRQYLIVPQTVYDTFGEQFAKDLTATMHEFFPRSPGYQPNVVPYDDRGPKTFVRQAQALRAAIQAECSKPGYALVMLHATRDRRVHEEDQLGAMVVRELHHHYDIRAAVIHTEVPQRAYREGRRADGKLEYHCDPLQEKRLVGYLRNVAITKILLTNQRWPFVLSTPLHADLTLGVDVKHNTAGLLIVGDRGARIRSDLRESRQKERLLASQMALYLSETLGQEAEARGSAVSSIVIHRDGRSYPSEIQGIREGVERARRNGYFASGGRYTVLDISKTAPVPLRLYDIKTETGARPTIRNPLVGAHYQLGDKEAYICATGGPFLRQGTAHPLHVIAMDGTFPFRDAIEDLYALTTLAWTQPEGCTRYPITIKLNDRILAAEAGEYDEDALEFGDAGTSDSAAGQEVA